MVVVRDAVTGQLRAPTAAEFQALQAQPVPASKTARKAAVTSPSITTLPNGTRTMSVGEDLMTYSVVRRADDGALTMLCVTGADAAAAAVAHPSTANQELNHAND